MKRRKKNPAPNQRSSGQRWRDVKGKISPAELRGEGVREIGRASGTAFCFVLTEKKLHLFHTKQLPDRALDSYAISLAVNWLEDGHSAFTVASHLDINPNYLTRELERVGYQRTSVQDGGLRAGADRRVFRAKRRRAKKLKDGRLVRAGEKYFFKSTHS